MAFVLARSDTLDIQLSLSAVHLFLLSGHLHCLYELQACNLSYEDFIWIHLACEYSVMCLDVSTHTFHIFGIEAFQPDPISRYPQGHCIYHGMKLGVYVQLETCLIMLLLEKSQMT